MDDRLELRLPQSASGLAVFSSSYRLPTRHSTPLLIERSATTAGTIKACLWASRLRRSAASK